MWKTAYIVTGIVGYWYSSSNWYSVVTSIVTNVRQASGWLPDIRAYWRHESLAYLYFHINKTHIRYASFYMGVESHSIRQSNDIRVMGISK